MNAGTPILEATDWDDLVARMVGQPQLGCLRNASPGTVRGVLAAPAAVARWLACSGNAMPSALRLLVIGAEKLDALDAGRWYQLLPALLGRSMQIEVTLVGDRLNAAFESPLRSNAPATPARMHVGRLSSFLDAVGTPSVDLAVLFHPGFQKHRGWLEDGSLRHLAALDVPVVVVSYEADEAELEGWVVDCHGFQARAAPVLNPFYIDFSDRKSLVHWGRAMWRLGVRDGSAALPVDRARLDALDRLGEMVLHSIDLEQPVHAPYGQQVSLQAARGDTVDLVYIFDDYLTDPATGTLFALRSGALVKVGTLPRAQIAAYPGRAASDLARAVWAADMKYRHLLDRYARKIDPATLHRRARGMHAALEDKVERLFRA